MSDKFNRIPDRFKTQEMCDKAVKKDYYSLQFVPDWFVKQRHIGPRGDGDYDGGHWEDNKDEDSFFKWYYGYKTCKAQKTSIKEELLLIAWHPSRYWDWCMSEDEKQETEKLCR